MCMTILRFICLLTTLWWKLEADLLEQLTFPGRSFKLIFRISFQSSGDPINDRTNKQTNPKGIKSVLENVWQPLAARRHVQQLCRARVRPSSHLPPRELKAAPG